MASSRLLFLALAPQLAVRAASECPPGAKPFPSSLSGQGKKNYADLFDIQYEGTYKVVKYSNTLSYYNSGYHPDSSMKGKKIPPLVLYQCGTTKPSFGDNGIDTSEVRFFQIPVQNATIGWGGPLPFFELLSVTEAIRTIDLSYISSPCGQLLEECIPGVHAAGPNWTDYASANEVIFTDSFGTGWAGPEKDIPFQISLDPGSLQRAEWIRFVAAFFNEDVQADEIFQKIETDYKALKALGLQLSTNACTEWSGQQPKVLFVTKTFSGGFEVNNAHYKRDFVQDAGGRLVTMPASAPQNCSFKSNTDGSRTLNCQADPAGMASFKSFLAEADVIIDESYVANHKTDTHDFSAIYSVTAGEVPALARNPPNIFRLDGTVSDTEGAEGRVGSAWFEGMPSQPQQLLAGIMEAMWADDFESPCGLKYLRRAIQNQGQTVLGDDDCPYHDVSGSHRCDEIHDHLHEVPKCAEGATLSSACQATTTITITITTTTEEDNTNVDGAMGLLSSASALAAIVAFWFLAP